MKRILLLSVVFVLAAACSRERLAEPRMVEWTFDTEYTKAVISDGGDFSWQQGDRIDVWNAAAGAFVPFTTLAGKGRFTASAPSDARFSGAAFYPSGIAGSTSDVTLPAFYASPAAATSAFPMYAAVKEGDKILHFKHLGAMISITITGVGPELTRLDLRSGEKALSGRFDLAVSGGNQVIQAVSGSAATAVSFSYPESGTLSVTLPVPVGEYPISICLGTETDPELLVVSSTGSLAFERAHRYLLKPVDYMQARYGAGNGSMESLTVMDDSANWE